MFMCNIRSKAACETTGLWFPLRSASRGCSGPNMPLRVGSGSLFQSSVACFVAAFWVQTSLGLSLSEALVLTVSEQEQEAEQSVARNSCPCPHVLVLGFTREHAHTQTLN